MSKSRNLSSLIKKYQNSDLINTIEKGYQSEVGVQLDVEKIRFNRISTHQFFLSKNLMELTKSIEERGVLSPILVRKKNDYYEVVSGYKRFYIAKKLQLKTIPAVIQDVNDDLLIYLVLTRATHILHDNILNKTYAFEILTKEYHVSRNDIATISNISISQVNNIMRLKNLSDQAINALKKEKISYGQARVLVNLNKEKQLEYLDLIISKKLSVHDIENMVKREKRPFNYVNDIINFENKHHAKVNMGRKNLSIRFERVSDFKKFLKDYLNNFKD